MKSNGVLGYGTLVKAWTWLAVSDDLKEIEPLHGMMTNAERDLVLTVMDAVRGGAR